MHKAVETFMADVVAKNPAEPQFHQAVREVLESIMPIVESNPATGRRASSNGWSSPNAPSRSGCPGSTTRARCRSTADTAWR